LHSQAENEEGKGKSHVSEKKAIWLMRKMAQAIHHTRGRQLLI